MAFSNLIIQPLSNLGHFWQQKINGRILRWNLIFISLQIAILVWKFNQLPPQIPLYYSRPWGDSQLANASYLFLLPTISIVSLLINNLFAVSFFKIQPLLSRLLTITSVIVSLFSLITILNIVILIS